MKTHVECFPCIINQTLEAADKNEVSEAQKKKVVYDVLEMLKDLPAETSPPEVSLKMHQLIGSSIGQADPYEKARRDSNVLAMDLIPALRRKIQQSADPLEMAIRYAIAGQIFDGEVGDATTDIKRELEYAPTAEFGARDYNTLKKELYRAKKVIILGNAAGEIAFDRLLIEVLNEMIEAEIVLVVKSEPVLTDATIDDARFVGLEPLVHLVGNKSGSRATILDDASARVQQQIDDADVILAKGQTHYESLNQENLNMYFLFQVTCPVISRDIDADMHQYVILENPGYEG